MILLLSAETTRRDMELVSPSCCESLLDAQRPVFLKDRQALLQACLH